MQAVDQRRLGNATLGISAPRLPALPPRRGRHFCWHDVAHVRRQLLHVRMHIIARLRSTVHGEGMGC